MLVRTKSDEDEKQRGLTLGLNERARARMGDRALPNILDVICCCFLKGCSASLSSSVTSSKDFLIRTTKTAIHTQPKNTMDWHAGLHVGLELLQSLEAKQPCFLSVGFVSQLSDLPLL